MAKRRELAGHERAIEVQERAIEVQERAVEVQERLGHPEWAEAARDHARHARELLEYALRELQESEGDAGRRG